MKDIPYIFTNNAFTWQQYCEAFIRDAPIELHSKVMRDMKVNVNTVNLDYRSINLKKIIYSNNNLEFIPLGNYTLQVDENDYKLQKFYFISNSVFRVLGKPYLLEGHFLYEAMLDSDITKKPHYLVLVVFYEVGNQGVYFKNLVNNLPTNKYSPRTLALNANVKYISLDTDENIIPNNIEEFFYYEDTNHYNNFCPNGVSFLVLQEKLQISQYDSNILNSLIGDPKFSIDRSKDLFFNSTNNEQHNIIPVASAMSDDNQRLKIDPEYYIEQDFRTQMSNFSLKSNCSTEDNINIVSEEVLPKDNINIVSEEVVPEDNINIVSEEVVPNKELLNSNTLINKKVEEDSKINISIDDKNDIQQYNSASTSSLDSYNSNPESKDLEAELILQEFETADDISDLY